MVRSTLEHARVGIETGEQVRLAFRLHVETRGSDGWRRLAEPVRSRQWWTRCGNCGERIRAVRVVPDDWGFQRGARFEHIVVAPGTLRCVGATPAPTTVPIPWHSSRIGTELAGILAGDPVGTRERFPAISRARGLPGDASHEVQQAAHDDAAGFSHSHLSVRELLAYDWHQTITREALVADRDDRFSHGGRAAHAAFWAFYDHQLPSGVREVDASAADAVRVTWAWPAWAAAGREFLVTVTRLGGVAADNLDAVRGVFWFREVTDGS
jgi:hypothetical protein